MKRFIFLVFIVLGCSPEAENDSFTEDPVNLNVGTVENCAETETICAMSDACGEEFLNLIDYQYVSPQLEFTMYFSSEIQDNLSLEALRNNFEYIIFALQFPEQKTATTSFGYSNTITALDNPEQEDFILIIDDYEEGVISGTLTGKITEMSKYTKSDDPECIIEDVAGVCEEEIAVEKEVTVDFSFCLENYSDSDSTVD
ncbi:hypothetical protein RM549_00050 [Salegentibacter sp. F188]|uniref:Lipoprotein n=1 Tax=Autumnicola patrickiae TaxID=3075591 RepID=A0ABU3DWS6_9FLAO|nr:hypothetical protein [Salegentibacter sp. F188]MDT0688158.1 hypothetical protein [Salegentibacter sp. F188]